jgi:hypothetical protein
MTYCDMTEQNTCIGTWCGAVKRLRGTRREMSTQRKKRRMHICLGLWRQKGMDVCAGWAARMGKWASGFLVRVESSQEQKAKAKIGKAKAGLFHSPDAFSHHTHTHTRRYSSLSKQIRTCTSPPRPASPANALLLLLLDLWAKKRAPFVSCSGDVMCVCVCGDRRSCSVRSFLTRSSSQTGSLGRFESRRVSRITCVMKGWLWWSW